MSDSIRALASSMISRKRASTDPYILFLGAGASISSGCSSMMQIVDDVLKKYAKSEFDKWENDIENATQTNKEFGELLREKISKNKRVRFFEIWGKLDHDTQYSILRRHLWENKNPSEGYENLVMLIKKGFIKTVLSTNLDSLLERSLGSVGWYQPDKFIVTVNGKECPEEIVDQLKSSRAPLKIIKLHGSLESPNSYAFKQDEIFDFEKKIKPDLSQLINQSLIITGYSGQDRDVDVLFENEGKEIHFVNPTSPDEESRISQTLTVRGKGKIISGNDGKFDTFFKKLLTFVEDEEGRNDSSDSGASLNNFLISIGFGKELENPRSRYKNLITLYVKPTEYGEICSKLERDHVIFIIGEPHLGKTYTAIHLLWEYYQKGYGTLHIRHDNLVTMLHEKEGSLKNLLLSLMSSKGGNPVIIHFDDPFGETMERRTDEFAKGLNDFLLLSKKYEHLRIIVTTRLNIFRETLAEQNCQDIEGLEKDLRVHTSYKSDVLIDILHRYIQFYKPLWSTDEKIIKELDEKLPKMLPAPHNIEFFVRTSERLTSLEEVLQHVENSKEMVKALGEWMKSLSVHEQIFLIWVEIQSTSKILFPNDFASKISFKDAYRETLAYLYKKEYICSIPPSSFSVTKDKFDMILLESREENSELEKFDFVHPSYHEAFWYAIKEELKLLDCWIVLKENLEEILGDLDNKLDRVQLRMIENYGTINRNLDQLLLISAVSGDIDEQSIALSHMMERIDIFTRSTSFSPCVRSVISSYNPHHKLMYINSLSNCYNSMPADILDESMILLVDNDQEVQLKYIEFISNNLEILQQQETLSKYTFWSLIEKVQLIKILQNLHDDTIIEEKLIDRFTRITPKEFEILFENNLVLGYRILSKTFFDDSGQYYELLDCLSSEQKKNIKLILEYCAKSYETYIENKKSLYKGVLKYEDIKLRFEFQRLVERANKGFNKKLDSYL